jgi:hypothetical protein
MLLEVGQFCERVESDLSGLADDLQEWTGRFGESERRSWMRSLPKLSVVLAKPELSRFHMSLGLSGHVAFEYRLPASSAWCDVVLLGQARKQPAAVVLELKDWDVTGDTPGPREALITHQGRLTLHPSDQVRGYVQYCRRFHSAVADYRARVDGCVFFTSNTNPAVYRSPPHDELEAEFPVFTSQDEKVGAGFVPYLQERLDQPAPDFAAAFDRGVYRQDRSFVRYIASAISDSTDAAFVLLDEQRRGFEYCLAEIDKRLALNTAQKQVIIIQGPPGSGKSVLAAHLWAALAQDTRINGNVVLVTTSSCQRSNWEHLFKQVSGDQAGKGVVITANRCNPGLTTGWIKKQVAAGHTVNVTTWQDNLRLFNQTNRPKIADDTFEVAIVDEAHALIDPTAPNTQGVQSSGWGMTAGPQAYHVMRCSKVSIFLMDSEQSYRDNETTKPADIESMSQLLGVKSLNTLSLEGNQFRCGGSAAYVDWLDCLLSSRSTSTPPATWNRANHEQGTFQLELVDDPQALDEQLLTKSREGRSVRLAATYARKWVTKGLTRPHLLPPEKRDFHIAYDRGGQQQYWSKIWNYAPSIRGDADYSMFIQGPEGSAIGADPLCEVGCPYVMRGFDFDYLGVLWLSDLVWRTDRWIAQPEHVHDSALRQTRSAVARIQRAQKPRRRQSTASLNPATPNAANLAAGTPALSVLEAELVKRLQRGYRIILSRAIHGIWLWVEDAETRSHLKSLLDR